MGKTKAYIYSRISPIAAESVLRYQTDLLKSFALDNDMEVVTINQNVSFDAMEKVNNFEHLVRSIRRELIDVVLIYSPNRISDDIGEFEEFEMFCKMHNVSIISLINILKN